MILTEQNMRDYDKHLGESILIESLDPSIVEKVKGFATAANMSMKNHKNLEKDANEIHKRWSAVKDRSKKALDESYNISRECRQWLLRLKLDNKQADDVIKIWSSISKDVNL